jgi:hypothetical protein
VVERDLESALLKEINAKKWAYDFLHDTCANGQKLKLLTVVDEWIRACLALRSMDASTLVG